MRCRTDRRAPRAARTWPRALTPDTAMYRTYARRQLAVASAVLIAISIPTTTDARQASNAPAAPPQRAQRNPPRIGIDAFGGAGITWPAAADSFDAVGLGKTALEVGGGARLTGLWRDLFAQAAVHRWSDTGE